MEPITNTIIYCQGRKGQKNPENKFARRTKSFYTSILKNLRDGKSEFVFNETQLQKVKEMLREDEPLEVRMSDGNFYILNLKENN